jgi:glutathione S-transferase
MHIAKLNDLRVSQVKLNYLQVLIPKFQKKEPDTAMIARTTATIKGIFGFYEAMVSKRPETEIFLVAGQLTILDFILAQCLIATAFVDFNYGEEFPGLQNYFNKLAKELPLI